MLGGRRAQGQEARRGLVRRNEGRAHARGNALAFILIGKYNDRLSPSLRSEGTYVVEERRRKREGEGGGGEGRLRTRVAAHLLRADSNCFPYLRTSTATL